jgi:hypothetical protein
MILISTRDIFINGYKVITKYNSYEVVETPTMIHAVTFEPYKKYLIKSDDGKTYVYEQRVFLTLAKWREQQINSILDE